MIPSADYNTFKKVYNDVVITKPDGTAVTEGLIGTGYKITTGGKTYTAIKLGDPTGDGKINILDSLRIRKYIIGEVTLDKEYLSAADSTCDTKVNILDSLKIRKYIINETTIDL